MFEYPIAYNNFEYNYIDYNCNFNSYEMQTQMRKRPKRRVLPVFFRQRHLRDRVRLHVAGRLGRAGRPQYQVSRSSG